MQRNPVTSSNLVSVGYDAATETLEVEFKSGGVWAYSGVPQEAFDGLVAADAADDQSVGKFYHQNIKSKFEGTKAEPFKEEAAA